LGSDTDWYNRYGAGIQDLLVRGFVEEVPVEHLSRQYAKLWYLPHHPVFQPPKDKVLVVFDCFARYSGSSLYDHILKDPDLMNNLTVVLIQFREEVIATMGDLEAMFHQVRVTPDDCDVLRFVWW